MTDPTPQPDEHAPNVRGSEPSGWTETADPLHAYSGRDRILRDCIENVIFKATVGGDMPPGWRGTLWLANEIMGHVTSANHNLMDGM